MKISTWFKPYQYKSRLKLNCLRDFERIILKTFSYKAIIETTNVNSYMWVNSQLNITGLLFLYFTILIYYGFIMIFKILIRGWIFNCNITKVQSELQRSMPKIWFGQYNNIKTYIVFFSTKYHFHFHQYAKSFFNGYETKFECDECFHDIARYSSEITITGN